MESLEVSAKTEEEAVEIALEKLDAVREEVEVVVLKRGKTRFLGLGSEETTVRVTRRQSEETKQEAVTLAKEVLEELLQLMKISAAVDKKEASSDEEAPVALNITGDDLGILIGRRGQTLFSLQHIVYLIVSHKIEARVPITIDVEGYRERRQEALTRLANRIAESVAASGQSVDLEPMPANERRIIHLALQNHSVVTTESAGEGESRKVTIKKR